MEMLDVRRQIAWSVLIGVNYDSRNNMLRM